jgi:hypothetical protein
MFKAYVFFIITLTVVHSECLTILFTSIFSLVSLSLSQVSAPPQLSVYAIAHLSILASSERSLLLSSSITWRLFVDALLYSLNIVSTFELHWDLFNLLHFLSHYITTLDSVGST